MAAGLWSSAPFSLKTDAQLQLLHRFESSGLVLAICFTCESQVHKTELRLKKCCIWRAPLKLCLVGTIRHVAGGVHFSVHILF